MNKLNVASLSASKKLVDNGILVREIKFGDRVHHITGKEGIVVQFDPLPVVYCENGTGFRCDPRTLTILYSFTDVWRELPDEYCKNASDPVRYKVFMSSQVGYHSSGKDGGIWIPYKGNPTDALIDLLVWLKGAGK